MSWYLNMSNLVWKLIRNFFLTSLLKPISPLKLHRFTNGFFSLVTGMFFFPLMCNMLQFWEFIKIINVGEVDWTIQESCWNIQKRVKNVPWLEVAISGVKWKNKSNLKPLQQIILFLYALQRNERKFNIRK